MKTFHELYLEILKQEAREGRHLIDDYNPYHMDCLLHPKRHAPVVHVEECEECAYERACETSCVFDAIEVREGEVHIDPEKCSGCGVCVDACRLGRLAENKDVYPVLEAIRGRKSSVTAGNRAARSAGAGGSLPVAEGNTKSGSAGTGGSFPVEGEIGENQSADAEGRDVYALVAPAFIGQFGEGATPGRLRSAFKALGFKGMVEVAVFADILTLKEALEFDRHVHAASDFQLTSCCCPVWISMIRNIYGELVPHVPGAVSPMIAAGRVVKKLYPGAMTVFIGPCMAKKKEAREPDIAGAVDYVLTFQEVKDIFDAAEIRPEELPEDGKEHSSRAGRIYARTGGVSEAVRRTVEQLHPGREIAVRAEQADGVPACRALIEGIRRGETSANFFEGMACRGGCVGGPKAILDAGQGSEAVDRYGDGAAYRTPLENPYVMELLARLGFGSVEDFLEKSDILTRDFG